MSDTKYYFFLMLTLSVFCLNPAEGQTALYDSLKLSIEEKDPAEKIDALRGAAIMFEHTSLEKGLYFAREREKLVRSTGNDTLIAENQKLFGNLYLESGLYDNAERYYHESLNIFKSISAYDSIASVLHNLGLVYSLTSDTIKAIDFFRQSIDARLEAGNPRRIGDGYTTLGEIYLQYGYHEKSIATLMEALNYYSEQISYARKYDCLAFLADNMIVTDPPRATRWIGEMEKLYSITPRYHSIRHFRIDFRLGQYYLRTGDIDRAVEKFDAALTERPLINREYKPVETFIDLADALFRKGRTVEALEFSELARRINKMDHDSITSEILGSFKTRLDIRSTEEEIKRNEDLKRISESRLRTEALVKYSMIAVLLILLASIIILLFNFISIRKSQNRLANRLAELESGYTINIQSKDKILEIRENKNIFFNILTDKLIVPFTELTDMLNDLSKEANNNFRKEDFISKMEEINRFALKVEKSLKRILIWSKLQRGQYELAIETIKVNDYLHELLPEILKMAIRKNLKIRFDIDPKLRIKFDRKAFRSIIKIIIENSIDASPPRGEVIIRGQKGNNGSVISVTDFGSGIPSTIQSTLFDVTGIKSNKSKTEENKLGLGLLMARHLAELNNSYLSFDSNSRKGTTFYIHIKDYNGK